MEISELIDAINKYKNSRKITLVYDYKDDYKHFKLFDKYKQRDVLKDLSVDEIIKIIYDIDSELIEMKNQYLLYSYEIEECHFNTDENISYEIHAMRPTSYGATGILGFRIFILNTELANSKIDNIKEPYRSMLHKILNEAHPYWYAFEHCLEKLNSDYEEFFTSKYDEYYDDLRLQYINMEEYKNELINRMKNNSLFNNIINDFIFAVDDSKKKLDITNQATGFNFKLKQFTETHYFCEIQ